MRKSRASDAGERECAYNVSTLTLKSVSERVENIQIVIQSYYLKWRHSLCIRERNNSFAIFLAWNAEDNWMCLICRSPVVRYVIAQWFEEISRSSAAYMNGLNFNSWCISGWSDRKRFGRPRAQLFYHLTHIVYMEKYNMIIKLKF